MLKPVADRLRRIAPESGVHIVDLPRVFEEWSGGGMPDSRLFLDYCHMSSQGIRVGMAAVTEQLAAALGSTLSLQDAVRTAEMPSPIDEAHAHLAAAVHNAHWGQPQRIVARHCEEAIQTSPEVVPVVAQYAHMQAHRTYSWLWSRSTECMSNQALSRYILQCATGPTAWQKIFDRVLVDALVGVLERAGESGIRSAIDCIQQQDYAIQPDEVVNLLDSIQSPSWCHLKWFPNQAHAYYRAYGSSSRFVLVCAEPQDITLGMTLRRPRIAAAATCDLVVNGEYVRGVDLSEQWKTVRIETSSQTWRAGPNEIELKWAVRLGEIGQAKAQAVSSLQAGVFPDLMLAYAEIFSFTAHRSR